MDIKIIDEDTFWIRLFNKEFKTDYENYLMYKRGEYHYIPWAIFWDEFISKKPSNKQ